VTTAATATTATTFAIDIRVRRGQRILDVAFTSRAGLTALFGPSGAGKTTVLDAIAGLIRPERGRISVGGAALFDSTAKMDLPPERRAVGYVFQESRLFPHRRVRDNLLFGWRLAPPERRTFALDDVVAFLGIAHLLDRMPRTLSGGEAQRVALGRALLSGPSFLLMDEPLSSLDAPRREEIMAVIERIRDELRLPILYVSHDRGEVERLAGEVIALDQAFGGA
jgi:molybdate transport system ATP-binding protein